MSAAHKRRRLRLPRAEWLGLATGLLALGLLAALAILVVDLSQDLRGEQARSDALARQVEGLGGTPVAGPSGEPGVGVTGPAGPPGPSGAAGRDAPTVTPAPGPSGPAGKDGADSTVPGPSGAPGADSTVPGPSGAPGMDGRDGTDGEDGQPPAGWSFTYRGVEYECRPVDGFDPGAPEYRCEPSDPDPDSGGGQVPEALALDPRRTQYA